MTYLIEAGLVMYWGTSRWSPFEIFESYSIVSGRAKNPKIMCNLGKQQILWPYQRLKYTFFEFFFQRQGLWNLLAGWRKNSKNIDFSLWGNRATTFEIGIFFHVLAIVQYFGCWSLVQPSIEHSFKQELLVGCYRVLQYQLFWPLVCSKSFWQHFP